MRGIFVLTFLALISLALAKYSVETNEANCITINYFAATLSPQCTAVPCACPLDICTERRVACKDDAEKATKRLAARYGIVNTWSSNSDCSGEPEIIYAGQQGECGSGLLFENEFIQFSCETKRLSLCTDASFLGKCENIVCLDYAIDDEAGVVTPGTCLTPKNGTTAPWKSFMVMRCDAASTMISFLLISVALFFLVLV
eukprot:TRINITY_DN2188_c2_g1_i1.p1 TRINITY_DN2188_c2_g1~~TRINITY_DN2188_c2_g1_i1.p1  ORF type:complete len:215 (+),score=46.26 TRINITY_DN2188_c2_g1_i1:48-647(+)